MESAQGTVIVVEPDLDLRESLQEWLNLYGFEVCSCAAVDAAVQMTHAMFQADALVVDLGFNQVEMGLRLLPQVRQLRPNLPVAFMTAQRDEALFGVLRTQPKVELFYKPFDLDALEMYLHRIS